MVLTRNWQIRGIAINFTIEFQFGQNQIMNVSEMSRSELCGGKSYSATLKKSCLVETTHPKVKDVFVCAAGNIISSNGRA